MTTSLLELQDKEWVTSANDSMYLRLVRSSDPAEDNLHGAFQPEFTYPVFGDEEAIFGYKDLKIELFYAAGSLFTYLGIEHGQKINDQAPGTPRAQDVPAILGEKLAPGFTDNYDVFVQKMREDEDQFKPMGEKFHEYQLEGDDSGTVYEIYKCTFSTPRFKEYHQRLQLFLLWFIEGASFLEDDEKWEIALVFEKRDEGGKDVYSIIGYATYYPFFYYPDKRRMRISSSSYRLTIVGAMEVSLLVRSCCIGGLKLKTAAPATLYQTLYSHFRMRDDVAEITVEDPNDAFQDLRDRCDLQLLLNRDAFAGLEAPVDPQKIIAVQKKYKLSRKQTERCLEMALLKRLKIKDLAKYKAYRLQVKRRVYRQNAELLASLDQSERVQKLDETYKAIEEGYRSTLASL
ncbi:histone acetyltransferase 1 [Borealophlyctis nickersoniae]|nr:histone acetyltransferase 1 [Borealophlyctis nickersoniae]